MQLIPLVFAALIFTVQMAHANCTTTSTSCSRNGTANVAGVAIPGACLEVTGQQTCTRPPVDQCSNVRGFRPASGENAYCREIENTCIRNVAGVCDKRRYRYECLNASMTMGQAVLENRQFENFQEDVDTTCNGNVSGSCELQSTSVIQGSQTRNINGLDVHRSWWERRQNFDCTPEAYDNTCGVLENNTHCTRRPDEACIGWDEHGTCDYVEVAYDCDGSVTFEANCEAINVCVGDNCLGAEPEASEDFPMAAAWLTFLDETASDVSCSANVDLGFGDQDPTPPEECTGVYTPQDPAVFSGSKKACEYTNGIFNCCNGDGSGATCGGEDVEVVQAVNTGRAHYLRTICKKKIIFGICVRRERQYCIYNSKFARVFQEQAHLQIGGRFDPYAAPHCPPLTIEEMESLDMEAMDLSEVYGDMIDNADIPVEDILIDQLRRDLNNFGGQVVFGN